MEEETDEEAQEEEEEDEGPIQVDSDHDSSLSEDPIILGNSEENCWMVLFLEFVFILLRV